MISYVLFRRKTVKAIKVLGFAIVASLSLGVAQAKDLAKSEVPAAVLSAFEAQFPDVVVVKYDFDDDEKVFEIDAEKGTLEIEVKYRKDGVLLESKEDVRAKDIPAAVLNAVQEQYPKAKVLGANRVFKNGTYFWDVGVKDGRRHRNMIVCE